METTIQKLEERMYQISSFYAAQMYELAEKNAAQMAQLIKTNTEMLHRITQLEAEQAAYTQPNFRHQAQEKIEVKRSNHNFSYQQTPFGIANTSELRKSHGLYYSPIWTIPKTVSSIFQRCMDIWRPNITKIAYIDDVTFYTPKYRLMIDLFKLEAHMIEDRCPIPETIDENVCETFESYQPIFNKPFELTINADNFTTDAILSQGKQSITVISRILSTTEKNYTTIEKELLTIVWALRKIRKFLHGIEDLVIYTEHRSLEYLNSGERNNSRMKRWKILIKEFGVEIKYRPENKIDYAQTTEYLN